MTREEREEKVLKTVAEWLPELGSNGTKIEIEIVDPDKHEGALFVVARSPIFHGFACPR